MNCFICNSRVISGHSINQTSSKYRKLPLHQIIYKLIGKKVEFTTNVDEVICDMCKVLLDTLDRLQCEAKNVENILMQMICRKYKMENHLIGTAPVIKLDENAAMLYVRGGSSNSRFQCRECSFATNYSEILLSHSLWHESKTVQLETLCDSVCANCNLSFPSQKLFDLHRDSFHMEVNELNNLSENIVRNAKFDSKCGQSKTTFYKEEIFSAESNDEDILDLSNEPICGKYAESNGDEKESQNSLEDPKEFIMNCEQCPEAFSTVENYAKHMIEVHFTCSKCKIKCRNEKTLRNHIKRRHTKHTCGVCGKELGSLISYQAHLSTHETVHKFTCTYCNKGFRAKSLLATHIVIHTKEYNFTCHICGQKFIHQRSHRLHVQWHDNPRPYQCPFCDKMYKHRSHLAVHRRTHSGERPNACDFCDKRFSSSTKLKAHVVMHTGVYSHQCLVCGKGYIKRHKLADHMLNVHGDNTMLLNKPKCEYKIVVKPDSESAET